MSEQKLDDLSQTMNRFIASQEIHNLRVNNFMNSESEQNKKVLEEIAAVGRGVYGDKKNGYSGLIDRQQQTEADVKNLKQVKNRAMWTGSGIIIGVNAIIFFIKEFFKN